MKSEQELLNDVFHFVNAGRKLCVLSLQDGACNYVPWDTASTAEVSLVGYIYIRNVLYESDFGYLTLSSQSRGKWRMISRGSVSAARMTNSARPLLSALVVSLAPFLICWFVADWLSKSWSCLVSLLSALGHALVFCSSCNFVSR